MTEPELTRDEAIGEMERLATELYRAEDRVAFVREMLTGRTEPVTPATVLAWLDHQHCPRVESEQQQIKRLTVERDRLAAEVAEWRTSEQHGAFVTCDHNIRTATMEAFARKISEKRDALAQRAQAVADAQKFLDRARAAEAELEQLRDASQRVTDHTYEGDPGDGQPCQTERFGQTCGAPWEQHEMRDDNLGEQL